MYNPIIDGDGIIYAISSTLDNQYLGCIDSEGNFLPKVSIVDKLAKDYLQKKMRSILNFVQANRYIILYHGSNDYRTTIDKSYKSHRKEKPIGLNRVRQLLIDRYKAIKVEHIETDDACCITYIHYNTPEMIKLYGIPILCHSDKDLKQITGKHLILPKNHNQSLEIQDISDKESTHNLILQLLMGDSTDTIHGIEGIGVAKALDIIRGVVTKGIDGTIYENDLFKYLKDSGRNDSKLFQIALDCYIKRYGSIKGTYEFATNFLQVFMLRDTSKKDFEIPNYIKIKR
jgi:5'-3' exonuclease